MKRIICHWTAGRYTAGAVDKKHYHKLFEFDGKMVTGNHPIAANSSARGKLTAGTYAAHTRGCNTDSIGLSLCCMYGATEKAYGKFPMTEKQFTAMVKEAANLCIQYKIKLSPTTVLWHAEVQSNLGIKQNGKWDATVLPFKPGIKGAKACGIYLRSCVMDEIQRLENQRASTITTLKKPSTMASLYSPTVKPKSFWAKLFGWLK